MNHFDEREEISFDTLKYQIFNFEKYAMLMNYNGEGYLYYNIYKEGEYDYFYNNSCSNHSYIYFVNDTYLRYSFSSFSNSSVFINYS